MVRHRSNSGTTYKPSRDPPETPLTPRSPRSPHLHRLRLLTPPFSRPSTARPARKREHPSDDTDLDCDTPTLQLASSQSTNPTPSEMLSRGINSLALHGASASAANTIATSGLATPSARLSDDGFRRFSLPFERFQGSPASASSRSTRSTTPLESVHRYTAHTPTREQSALQSPQSTPVKNRPALVDRISTQSGGVSQRLVQSPQHGTMAQFMTDEENNLFLSQSPRAIRTPRRSKGRTETSSPVMLSERPVPLPDLLAAVEEHEASNPSGQNTSSNDVIIPDEDDAIETESIQSSIGGDAEKENHTPKFIHDSANPFLVGSTPGRQTRSAAMVDGSTTPTGSSSTAGNITRSRRLALGSISPWRWNTFDEQMALVSFANTKASKGMDLFDSSSSPAKGGCAVSEWIQSISPQKNTNTLGESVSGSGAASSSSSSASASASASTSSQPSSSRSRLATGNRVSSNAHTSSSSTSSAFGPLLQGKGATAKLPDHHPNSAESSERRGGPSSLVAKLAESVIQPHSQAFNRRAQQLEGRIYYWKHGSCHLVSEQDKQQWPGEWKFQVFQDPESPEATPSVENSDMETPAATYKGKGKMTERQLSGPASKRMKIIREPLGGINEQTTTSTSPQQQDPEPSMHTGTGIEQDATPPPSPSSRVSARRQETGQMEKQSRLQDRYDFRERRMLNRPLTSKSRRYGT